MSRSKGEIREKEHESYKDRSERGGLEDASSNYCLRKLSEMRHSHHAKSREEISYVYH
jgi:hypothetical protein